MEIKNPFQKAKIISFDTEPEAYHAFGGERGTRDYVMSRSSLAEFVECPSKWRESHEEPDTSAKRWGTLMDTLVMAPDQFDKRFAVYPDTYPCEPTARDQRTEKPWRSNTNFAKEWRKLRPGKMFIYREKFTEDDEVDEDTKRATLGNANRAKTRLFKDPSIKSLIDCSKRQVFLLAEYRDRDTGIVVPFKVMLDLVPDGGHSVWGKSLSDFKTARNASERAFSKAVHDGYYDWQGAIYTDIYVAATGEDRCEFVFAVQENVPPYETAMWLLPCDWMSDARAEVVDALRFYCSCLHLNKWPGYPATVQLPHYGILSREARMIRNIQVPLKEPKGEVDAAPELHTNEVVP